MPYSATRLKRWPKLHLIPTPSGKNPDEYWWEIAEKNSEVYTRRVRVIPTGI